MSSKSKKQKQKSHRQGHKPSSGVPGVSKPPSEEKHGLEIPDEVLHAPKESSKLRFALMIGLVIVLLIIFIVPTALFNLADTSAQGDEVRVRWQRPGHGLQEITANEFIVEKRAFEAALAVDPLVGFQFGLGQRGLSREDVARLIVLDQLAQDAGIRVTTADLAEHLQMLLNFPPYNQSSEVYKQVASQYGGGIPYVEATIKRCLAGQRFLLLAGFAGGIADPAKVEELWHRDHVEMAFETLALSVSDMDAAARAELPDDEALEAWFEDQPEGVKSELKSPEKRRAGFVRYVDPETTPAAGLLAAFPEPDDADPAERANEYYNRVFHLRFVKPPVKEEEGDEEAADEAGGEEEGEEAAGTPELQEFVPFEEVREQCLAEAPVYNAMVEWLNDLQTRQNAGEEIDLAAEAAGFGLAFSELEESLTREDLEAHAEFGDDALVNEVFFTPPEAFGYRVLTTPDEHVILRVTERVEPSLPPFEEIRDEVAELWLEPKRAELAKAKLQELWESFEEFEPEEDDRPFPQPDDGRTHRRATAEEFQAAADGAALQFSTRDFQDKADAEFGDDFYPFFRYEENEVSEPVVLNEGEDDEKVALVRVSAKREVPVEEMSPRDYDMYKSRARSQVSSQVATGFDMEHLAREYDLWLKPLEPVEDEEGMEDEPSE